MQSQHSRPSRITSLIHVLVIWGLLSLLLPGTATPVFAATQTISGTATAGNLRITVQDTGSMNVERYVSGAWQRQIYNGTSKTSALRINGTAYKMGSDSSWAVTGTQATSVSNTTSGLQITTVWTAGSTQVTQRVNYTDGNPFYRLEWQIRNTGATALADLRFFHGEDTFLQGGDNGAGWWDATNYAIGVRKTVSTVQQRMALEAETTPYAYTSQAYNAAYAAINAGSLGNVINALEATDNGYALEWRHTTLNAGETWTIVAFEKFTSGTVGSLTVNAPITTSCNPGTTCDLTYAVQNPTLLPINATFSIGSDQPTWSATVLSPGSSATVPASSSVSVVVRLTIPAGTTLGTVGRITLTANDGLLNSSDIGTVTIADTIAPAMPVVNIPAGGSTTNDSTPDISGTAEANSTVAVREGATLLCSATANASGNWTCTSTTLADGSHTLSVTATDASGNTSSAATRTFSIDATAPGAPSVTSPANGSVTNDSTPDISGTAEANSTVAVRKGATLLCSATANASGNWTCTSTTLADGSHTLSVTATDAVGNTSTATSRTFTVDTAAPAAPVVTIPASLSSTNDTTPDVSGTAEPNSTVVVRQGVAILCSATANASGNWTCTSTALTEGSHTLSVAATDAAGNTSTATTRTFSVDTSAPGTPVVTSPTSGSATNDSTPDISGTAEANSTVFVREGATLLCSTTANGSGSWTCTSTLLADANHTLSVTTADAAGNTSSAASRTFSVDTATPAAPAVTSPASSSVTNDATPDISGTAEANSTLFIREGATLLCSTTANASGNWTCTSTLLADGSHTLSVTAADAAGNTSPITSRTFSVDGTAPGAPSITSPASGSTTNDSTPDVTGTAEANSTVSVREGAALLCSAAANGLGSWTCTSTTLADGSHTLSVTATDAAGNTSTVTMRIFSVDTTSPFAPVVTSPITGSTTYDATPDISGTAEAGSTVSVREGTTLLCSVTADPSGAWSCTSTTLAEGSHTIAVTATDPTGNASGATSRTFSVDTVAPDAPLVHTPASSGTTNDATPDVSGTAVGSSRVDLQACKLEYSIVSPK